MNQTDGDIRIAFGLRMFITAFALLTVVVTSIICIVNGEFSNIAGMALLPATVILAYVSVWLCDCREDLVRVYGRKKNTGDTNESS